MFTRCLPEVMHCSQATMEKGISDNVFVDYRKKGSFFECTSISAVKDIMSDKVSFEGLLKTKLLLTKTFNPLWIIDSTFPRWTQDHGHVDCSAFNPTVCSSCFIHLNVYDVGNCAILSTK